MQARMGAHHNSYRHGNNDHDLSEVGKVYEALRAGAHGKNLIFKKCTALSFKLKFCPHVSSSTYFSYPQYLKKIIAL